MNTAPLKSFAVQSRNVLKQGVLNRILELGFDHDGNVREKDPVKVQGGAVFMGQLKADEGFYDAWMELKARIALHGIREVCEEAAYTWFNRLVAIRIMQKNHFIEPVMEYVDAESRVPVIVARARAGRLTLRLNADDAERLNRLIADPTRIDDQFKLLIEAFCELNPVIYNCFGGIDKYISLLLPDNILAKGGFVDLLNSTSYLTEEDFAQSELIGWLYQFYISEKKDEVFASKGKVSEEDIPAATQIFTPNWIAKYMVQNTIGRIYLDNNPDSSLEDGMKYLVKSDERTLEDAVLKVDDITEYKMIDPACGSGHILNEGFDLLYDMYTDEFYSPRAAVENIFQRNLIGIDIDTRAKQLSIFALLMKAARKDRSFLDAKVMPRVLDMPEPFECPGDFKDFLKQFFAGGSSEVIAETQKAFELLRQAKNLGSIMRFDLSEPTRYLIETRTAEWEGKAFVPEEIKKALPSMRLILALTDKYTAVVANPPYMGSGNMNPELSRYVNENYKEGKADLATVFVQIMGQRTSTNGIYAFIIPPSWMFLSTFEGLRRNIIDNQSIESLLHLSRGVFGADFGSSSAVIKNTSNANATGAYFRLVERTFQEFEQSHLRMLFEQTLSNHDFKYNFKEYTKDVTELPYYEDGNRIYYSYVSQRNFEKIPGCPIGYWVSEKISETFMEDKLSDIAKLKQGLATGNNPLFLRYLWEISSNKRGLIKWVPCTKGGSYRKWFGNIEYCVNWENNGFEIKNYRDEKGKLLSRPQNSSFYFKQIGITWSTIASGKPSFRYFSRSWLFETKGSVCFPENEEDNNFILGYLNTPLVTSFLNVLAPTLDYHEGPVGRIPYKQTHDSLINDLVSENISISKQDWDAHETSWDFKENEIVRLFRDKGCHSVEEAVGEYKKFWTEQFDRLHANEEELNRQFIDIYGLQGELTPDVPLDEVTILQQGEISIEEE